MSLHFRIEDDEPRDCDCQFYEGYKGIADPDCKNCKGAGRLGREGHEPEIEVVYSFSTDSSYNDGWYWTERKLNGSWNHTPQGPHETEPKAVAAAREALG